MMWSLVNFSHVWSLIKSKNTLTPMFERRICSLTRKPIASSDKASVQITLAELDQDGQITGKVSIYDISGAVRRSGIADGLMLEKIRSEE